MNITNTSGAQQQTLAPPSLPFNPSAPAFQPKVQSSQESHGALSQPVSTADTGSSQMSLLRDDFSDMRGRFAAFTAPFVQVKMAQTQSLATVSGLSFPEPAHSTHSTPPQFAAPISVGGEPRAAHPAQPRVQAPTRVHTNINTTSLGQTREIPKPPSRTATGTWVNIAEKGALALWTRAEKETAERDPQAWIALARQELDRLQEVYKPGSIPSEVLQAHLTKYASAYTAISEPREKTSVSATAAMPGTEATPTKLTDTRIGEKTPLQAQGLQSLVPDIDNRGRVVMKTTGKAGAESSDQAAPGPLTTPTQNRLMGSTMAQSSEDFSPGPAFPALGTHPGRKAPDKPGETIKIPYPGGPVSHNPRKTMPRPPQGPAAQMKTAAASLEVFVKPGNGRLRGAAARPKRSDQGPLPSEADVYPDDSVADVVSEKHSTVSPGARADSRTPRNRGNTNTSMAFSSPRHTPRDRRGTIDRRASVSSAKQSGFTPEQTPQSNRALTATVMPVEVAPLGTGRPTQGVTQLESNAMLQAVTADPPINMNFEPPPGMTELGTPSMNLLTAFSQLAQHCAQASAQQAHYYSQLSAIQEETGPSPTTAFFPAPPGFANIGGGPLAPAHQQTISAPPTAFPVFSGAPVPMNSMAGFYAAAPNPVPIPDGISDIQKISPLSTSFDEVGTPQTGPGPARQPPAPRFPVGNTYYRGLGQKMTALRPKPNGLAPDQLDGSRYGIEMGGVGLQCTGFVWSPPRPDRSTALGRMGYLWGQP